VTYVRSEPIENVFEEIQNFEVWQKVRKQPWFSYLNKWTPK
jgi:hypothetical protein